MSGKEIVKRFEGCKLSAYKCPAGKPTIGYGHTRGVYMGQKITQSVAESYLDIDYQDAERQVRYAVKVPLTENQLGALTSFVYNLGIGTLNSSTLLKKLNKADYAGAAQEFDKWVKATDQTTGRLTTLQGLVARRAAEKALFLQD